MNCEIIPHTFPVPQTFYTYMNPGEHELSSPVTGDTLDVTVMCMTSAPEDFILSASVGDTIRGFPPCPTHSFGNITVSVPISGISNGENIVITVNTEPSGVSEWCTVSSILLTACEYEDAENFGSVIYVIIGFFVIIAVIAIILYLCQRTAYRRVSADE